MRPSDLQELHYITTIRNVPSIMTRGILSHKRLKKINHNSVAMETIQDRRENKVVPGGRPLQEYVNLAIGFLFYGLVSEELDLNTNYCIKFQIGLSRKEEVDN